MRFSPPTLALGALLTATFTGCEETSVRTPCSPDEVRIAERCVPVGDTSPSADVLADTAEDVTSPDTFAPDTFAPSDATPDTSPTLPFFIDTRFIMSGYMGSGNVETAPCDTATPSNSLDPRHSHDL